MSIEERIKQLIKADPIQHFFPYSIELTDEGAILNTVVTNDTLNIFNTCHGGIMCIWSDAVLSATASYFTKKTCITVELSCSYKKTILPGEKVKITTKVLEVSDNKIDIVGDIIVNDRVVATNRGKFHIIKEDKTAKM